MNDRQRVVVVVALGSLAAVAATLANRLLADDGGDWFAYAPNTGAVFAPERTWIVWRDALVWVAATALWAGASLWLLRSRSSPD